VSGTVLHSGSPVSPITIIHTPSSVRRYYGAPVRHGKKSNTSTVSRVRGRILISVTTEVTYTDRNRTLRHLSSHDGRPTTTWSRYPLPTHVGGRPRSPPGSPRLLSHATTYRLVDGAESPTAISHASVDPLGTRTPDRPRLS